MSFYMVDVESDGPVPGPYSMVCFGAVIVRGDLSETFYGQTRPISDVWIPDALAVSGFTREQHNGFDYPKFVMENFMKWVNDTTVGKPIFISDNNGYDFAFMNYYLHVYGGSNPFGWSSKNLSDIYKGMTKDFYQSFKHLRKTKHDHHPVNDAKGNAEALMQMRNMGLKIGLK